ncbi:MAG: hypothetical protein R2865_17860, partial [Deinococcales bacterium]
TIIGGTEIAGHVEIGDFAYIGGSSVLHQFCRVGAYVATAGMSGILQDILPFSMAQGRPVMHYRLNKVGLERRGIIGERYKILEKAIRGFRRKDWVLLNELASQSEDVAFMLKFKESSERGLSKFAG